jgi:hypothetical protein
MSSCALRSATPSARISIPPNCVGHIDGTDVRDTTNSPLFATCGIEILCGRSQVGPGSGPELPRGDSDEPLEVAGELALVREPGEGGDLRQREVTRLSEEFPGALDAARDDVLVRRQPGGALELPGEVVGAEAGDRRQLLQGRGAAEVFLDVLDDGAEPPPRQPSVSPARRALGCQDVPDQADGQDVGQRLGGQWPPGAAGGQLGIHRPHRGPEVWQV